MYVPLLKWYALTTPEKRAPWNSILGALSFLLFLFFLFLTVVIVHCRNTLFQCSGNLALVIDIP